MAEAGLSAAQTTASTQPSLTPEERVAKVQEARDKYFTQEEREAAAARRQALLDGLGAQAVPVVGPLDQPDFFGSANWAFSPMLKKFVDTLPGLNTANNLGNSIPVAVPDTITYPGSDYYELSVVEFTQKLHSDLPATTLRGYVQTNKGTDLSGQNTIGPAPAMYLGPQIITKKDRPVRIKFTNNLPINNAGKLFIPVDTTIMGAGWGPLQGDATKGDKNFSQNRAVIHLHGGHTPWISDGTPHQWITPLGENTDYPKGVSVQNVPDMPDPGEGSQTYYYTNQQSARLLFYHDHSWGITRLNVYVGEAAGYLIRDSVEEDLIARDVIPKGAYEVPLIIQDKSFVDAAVIRDTDPTWNWGTGTLDPATGIRAPKSGDLWYPHVYSPAQNPYDLAGANPFGRWHYGPWFWPPTADTIQPVDNAYYDPANPALQPPKIPGVPWVSAPGESFFDTALVNGAAFPTMTVEPKAYRFRILNAANDRFWNLQMYVADPAQVSSDARLNTEIKMVPAAQTAGWPANWPTDGREGGVPDPTAVGPDWIQIGTEGGFLPQPAVIPNQPITWNNNPTTFNFGNVDKHSLLLGPAERGDVIVDFSQYAGKTLIIYNDAPAAFPAGDPRYDYYAGSPDLTAEGGYAGTQIGFGPNTRTVMQIKVSGTVNGTPYDLAALQTEFVTTATHDGVFKRSQNPILVGQSAYNTTYNTAFSAIWPLWGYSRIQDTSLTFQTLTGTTLTIDMQPKALHDEMGAAYDEYGRMSGKLGLEVPNPTSLTQNFVLQNFVDPVTEIIEDSMEPMSPVLGDGTQIWKITHNGVDTHPIHFHLFDVQVLNRVGWDGQIRLPDANELGWKDTLRVSPLEDTIVALRATASRQPFGQPDSVRPLNPAQPLSSPMGFSNVDPYTGQAVVPPTLNAMVNFGWEYVWHCHILSHEEMDMMRPIKFNAPRALAAAPSLGTSGAPGSAITLTWTDGTPYTYLTGLPTSTVGNAANEMGFRIERAYMGSGVPGPYATIGTALANKTTFVDSTTVAGTAYSYRVVAYNAAGDSLSNAVTVAGPVTTNRYEQTDPLLVYAGAWTNLSGASHSAGSMKYTSRSGSSVTAYFTGTSLTWVTRIGPSYGKAWVTLDGGARATIDLYSALVRDQQPVWSTGPLTDGRHSVKIEWSGQRNPAATFTYVGIDALDVAGTLTSAAAAPTVTSISPTSGPAAGGGATVTINGTGFTGATAVRFGDATAVFTFVSSTKITVASPPAGSGTVHVTVTASSGTSGTSAADQYTYVPEPTVTSISPTSGPAAGGGATVTINGTGFTGATAVRFGAATAVFTFVSSTKITVASPPAGTGTVDVTVTTPSGTSVTSAADQYTYVLSLTRYEETNARLVYAGTWTNLASAPYSGGSIKYTSRTGSTVTINFTGTSLALIAKTGNSYGKAQVTLDGVVSPTLIDLYTAAMLNQQQVWSTGPLTSGPHTVKIAYTGQKNAASSFTYVDIDAVDVVGILN